MNPQSEDVSGASVAKRSCVKAASEDNSDSSMGRDLRPKYMFISNGNTTALLYSCTQNDSCFNNDFFGKL